MDAPSLVTTEKNPKIPPFGPGDTDRVNFRNREGERERVQALQGVVIRLRIGTGPAATVHARNHASLRICSGRRSGRRYGVTGVPAGNGR